MKNKQNQQSGKGILRRFLAKTLALTMVLSFLTPAAPMTAYATELEPKDLGEQSCDSTIGVIKDGKSFDIQGKRTASTKYTTDTSSFNTSYRNNGYQTYIQISTKEVTGEKKDVKCKTNGGVQQFDREKEGQKIPDVEVKMTVLPSPDNKYIYVDYYVYNRENLEKTVKLGSCADIQLDGHGSGGSDPADTAVLSRTATGFHMLNTAKYSSFDCYTAESITGMPAPTTRWVGHYGSRSNNIFVNGNVDQTTEGQDSGLAYSWTFPLRPFELVRRRVAFACRVNSYYVSWSQGDDSQEGTYQKPYKTLEKAIQKIGNNKGYIYVMDYKPFTSSLSLSGTNDRDITIASTDFLKDGTSTLDFPDDQRIKTLERGNGYQGSLFQVTGGKWSFNDITLSGSGQASDSPVISATAGTLSLNTKSKVTGAKGTALNQGSAVDLSGSANLSMNGGAVTGNESKEGGKGAVCYNSSGTFTVLNEVNIQENKDAAGTPANVYLAAGKTITVEKDLERGMIGITSATLPTVMPGAVPTEISQEIPVAVPGSGYPPDMDTCPFVDNFKTDQSANEIEVATGAMIGANDNRSKAVLRRAGYSISFVSVDGKGMAVNGAVNQAPKFYGAGESVTENAPAPVLGYTLKEIKVDQGTHSSLQAVPSGADMGKITGTMPKVNVTVTYIYDKENGSISFEANGGTPSPDDIKGTVGDNTNALMPMVGRYGYKFNGWVEGNYDVGSRQWTPPTPPTPPNDYQYVRKLPDTFPVLPLKYYAIFSPDPSVKLDYTVVYQNQDGSITFQSKSDKKVVETDIFADKKAIHGYVCSWDDSFQMPHAFNFHDGSGIGPFGSFDTGSGQFRGRMPGQNASVTYRYKVDRGNPDAVSSLAVKYVTEDGRRIAPDFTSDLFPEEPINVSPKNLYGYDLVKKEITQGAQADDTDGHLVSQVTGDFDSAGNYTGKMPNQPVEITYTYKPNGEGYRFQVQHKDTESKDSRLQNIVPTVTETYPADTGVSAEVQDVYGYVFKQALENGQTSPGIGQFDGAHKYTALMPTDDLSVTYQYGRNSSQWATIHYDGGLYGMLSHDNERPSDDPNKQVSPDVIKDHDGSYLTEVLKADNQGHGDTWAAIKSKRLVPLVSLDSNNSESRYYRFAGWFIDGNGNKEVDGDETLISDDQTFAGDTTLTAAFEEDPDKWVDVQLTAGDHGTLTDNNTGNPISHPVTIHTHYDSKWGDLLLPNNKPEVNYLKKGWYDGARKIEDNDSLRNGATYTLQFYPDPLVFGTNAGDVDAAGSLDEDGKGRVTAFDTKPGYRYFITDLDGTILDVQDGSVTGRTVFDKRCPGTRYLVYEAEGSSDAAPGMKAAEVRGKHGNPSEVLTPVVEHIGRAHV